MHLNQHILTIAIPTYNRHNKLLRLLDILKDEIVRLHLSDVVRIIISDNSDNTITENAISNFFRTPFHVVYLSNKKLI